MKFLPINQSSVYPKPVLCFCLCINTNIYLHNIHEPSDIELMINLILLDLVTCKNKIERFKVQDEKKLIDQLPFVFNFEIFHFLFPQVTMVREFQVNFYASKLSLDISNSIGLNQMIETR